MVKPILVIGATGKQGGAVIRNLISNPSFSTPEHRIYAVTRNPSSSSAKRLASLNPFIEVIAGDVSDVAGIFESLPAKPWGVYCMTNLGKNEAAEGAAVVDEAIKAGASYFVFSSVDRGSANGGFTPTDVPHFITKHEIEAHLFERAKEAGGTMSYTIIRPPFFMENFEWGFLGQVVGTVWRDYTTKPIIMIATSDIGKVAAEAFMDSENSKYRNQAINLAGDRLTFEQGNEIFKEVTGSPTPTTYGVFAWLLMTLSHDFKAMLKFWNEVEFGADFKEGRANFGTTSFREWLSKSSLAQTVSETSSKRKGGIHMRGL